MRRHPDRPQFFLGGLRLATLLGTFVFGTFVLGACETAGPGEPGPGSGPEAATPEAGSAESRVPADSLDNPQTQYPDPDPQEFPAREFTAEESEAEPDPELAALSVAPQIDDDPAPRIDDDPAQLIGIDPARLDFLLGRPDLVRREPPAEIWQYRSAACIFDVFLYEEAGAQRVTYVEARNQAAEQTAPRPCLNGLLRARLPQPYG